MHATLLAATLVTFLAHPPVAGPKPEPFAVTIPGRGWQVDLEAPPLRNFGGQTKGEDFAFQAAGEGGFNLSIFVEEPRNKTPGNEACYEHYWPLAKRNPLIDQSSVKVVKAEKFVKVSYKMKDPRDPNGGSNLHANYFIAHEGRWVDVHASQYPARDDEAALFEAFEKSLRLGPAKPKPAAP